MGEAPSKGTRPARHPFHIENKSKVPSTAAFRAVLGGVEKNCKKCGSSVFFVDETVTHVQVDGEIVKTYQGELTNANCVRCTYPNVYPEYQDYEEVD